MYIPDLDIQKIYLHKNERSMSKHSKFRSQTGHRDTLFCSFDLDLDLMTLIYEFDPKILKTYLRTEK